MRFFKSVPGLPPGRLRMLLDQRRRLLTAAVKTGEKTDVFVLKGVCMDPITETTLQSVREAMSGCLDQMVRGTKILLCNVPEGGGVVDSLVFKQKPSRGKKEKMMLSLNPEEKAASIVRTDKFGLWETSNCFDTIRLPQSDSPVVLSAGDFYHQGPIPKSILDHFKAPDSDTCMYPEFPYKTEDLIGEGGQAMVYREISAVNGHVAAVRHISIVTKLRSGEPYAKGFFDSTAKSEYKYIEWKGEYLESNILRVLPNVNIKRMTASWFFEEYVYIAQEYMPSSLDQVLLKGLTNEERYILSIGLFQALGYLWKKEVLHKDIKPSNMFVDSQMNLKIGDFGSASFLKHGEFMRGNRTGSTVMFSAPEVACLKQHNHMADTYGGGCTYFQIHIVGDTQFRCKMQIALQELTRSPAWASNPREAWASSPISLYFTGNPEVLFGTMAFDAANRLPYEAILELIHQWHYSKP